MASINDNKSNNNNFEVGEDAPNISREDLVHTGGSVFIIEKVISTKDNKDVLVTISSDSVVVYRSKGDKFFLNKKDKEKIEKENDGDLYEISVAIIELEPSNQEGGGMRWKIHDLGWELFEPAVLNGLASISKNFESHLDRLL